MLIVFILMSATAFAAKDCIYSDEYLYDVGFEGKNVMNTGASECWLPYYNSGVSYAEIISDSEYPEYIYEGAKAIQFSNAKTYSGRGIFYKSYLNRKFKAGDTVELSGWFKTDYEQNAEISFCVGDIRFDSQSTYTAKYNQWTYIYGRYTISSDGNLGNVRINTNINENQGYIYADNLSLKRVIQNNDSEIVKIETKNGVYAAIDKYGKLWMWGKGSYYELNSLNNAIEHPRLKAENVSDVCIGDGHVVVLKKDGSLYTWGRNDYGQLGNGKTESVSSPQKIADNVKAIAAGAYHTVYVDKFGQLYGMGQNYCYSYCTSDFHVFLNPEKVVFNTEKSGIAVDNVWASKGHTFIKNTDGILRAIGYNGNAQLGVGGYLPQLRYYTISNECLALETNDEYTIITDYERKLKVSGFGMYGQFGSTPSYKVFTEISDYADNSAAGKYTMFKLSEGRITSRGDKDSGVLGTGVSTEKQISGQYVSVCADENYMYTSSDGQLYVNGEKIEISPKEEDLTKIVFDINNDIIYNISEEDGGSAIIAAAYTEGRLAAVNIIQEAAEGENKVIIPRIPNAEYKVMLWTGMKKMKPLDDIHLITLAEVSFTSEKTETAYNLYINGKTASIDGVYGVSDTITVLAYDNEAEAPSVNNIKACGQFYAKSNGDIEEIIKMQSDPEQCTINIKVSGDKFTGTAAPIS